MAVADKIGLISGFGWIAGHPLWVTLVLCLAVTPGAMLLIALLFEGRWLPLSSQRQFESFFPGDIFLGMAVAGSLELAKELPAREAWYNGAAWHSIALAVALIIAIALTVMELKAGVYPRRAIMSPTKLYRNCVLYCGYGYVTITTVMAITVDLDWSQKRLLGLAISTAIFGAFWLVLVIKDNMLAKHKLVKAQSAYVAD